MPGLAFERDSMFKAFQGILTYIYIYWCVCVRSQCKPILHISIYMCVCKYLAPMYETAEPVLLFKNVERNERDLPF